MKRRWSWLMIAGLAAPAVAQRPPAPPAGGRAMATTADGPGGQMGGRPDPAAMRQREGDDLALVLGLSATQRPALDAFLAAMMPPRRPDGPPPAMPAPGTTPPGFEQQLAMMQAEATRCNAAKQARFDAGRRLYAQLDTRQKQVFDALMRLRHGPDGHGDHGAGGPGPGRPDSPGPGRPDGPGHGPG